MPPQQQLTEEDLKNMTPEQIKELQKQNCIFCHIINGKVASKKVYEDETTVGILDINPANPGHILLLSKEHYQIMPQVPDYELGHMFMVAKALSHASLKALKVQGTNIFVANGAPAGQKAPHFMIHVIPRKEGDGVECFDLPRAAMTDEKLGQIEEKLKPSINKIFGIKEDEVEVISKPEEKKEVKKEERKKEKEEKPKDAPKKKEAPKAKKSKKEEDLDFDRISDSVLGVKTDGEDEEIDLDKIAELFK